MMNFNIQLFADAQTNTTGTMSVEMKTFYEKRLIDQAEPRLVHDQFADYYPVPQNGGKTIEFRKYDSLPKASTPLTEGVTPNGQALNVTSITSDLHQYGGWTPLTDVLQMTAIDNNVVQATRVLASQAGRTMDSITRDVLAGGTNVIYAPKLGADGTETAVTSRKALDKSCTLTPKLFFQAAAQLGAMNADPIGDSYVAIIHPYAAYDLKTCKEFMEVHKYADPDTMFRMASGRSFVMFKVTGRDGDIVGYHFLRCFWTGRTFHGLTVAPEAGGRGIGGDMWALGARIATSAGMDMRATISESNLPSLRSCRRATRCTVIERLPDGYLLVGCTPRDD